MSVDVIPEGQTIDPVRIAMEKLLGVFIFLRENNFEDQMEAVGDVLDQLGGWVAAAAQLDAKYPNDKQFKADVEWRKEHNVLP